MRIFISLVFLFFSIPSFANPVISRIEDIDYPQQRADDVLIFLSTGQVTKVSENLLATLEHIHRAKRNNSWLRITVNENREIIKVEDAQEPEASAQKQVTYLTSDYVPSVLKSPDWALKYFREARRKNKESQCFNRAHVWSYEWMMKHKFYSSKIFLFFTRKFVREHNFHWWFHVAPYVHVAVGNKIKERVMDMKYTHGPSTMMEWVKKFIKEDYNCLTVKTYSDYANFPENGNCYLMRASMYYYWPLDLENEELHGTVKTGWIPEEINTAYLEAFEIVKQ